MQTALDLAAYVLGATILAGVLLAGLLVYDLWRGVRLRLRHPPYVRLPCSALDATRQAHDRMKRRLLEAHLRRMEERVRQIEDRTHEEQAAYYRAVARREKLWRGANALQAQVNQMSRGDRQRSRPRLDAVASSYRIVEETVKEEWERGLARDKLRLDELRDLGALDETVLPKLLEQVRARVQSNSPEPAPVQKELPAPRQPHAEPLPGRGAAAAVGIPLAGTDAAAAPPDAQPVPATEPRQGIGRSAYERLREAVAPLFGPKAEPEPPVPAPVAQDIGLPPSEGKPAPLPARAESHPTQAPAGSPGEAIAPAPAASSMSGIPAPLRRADVAGTAWVAPGRRYGDPAFSVAELPRGILRHADLSGSDFSDVHFAGRHRALDCRFSGANLSRILLDPQPRPHQFVRCDFSGARFDGSRIGFALFHQCNLSGTKWRGARLERVRFCACVLDGVEWGDAEQIETRIAPGPPAQRPPSPAQPAMPEGAPTGGAAAAPEVAPAAPAAGAGPVAASPVHSPDSPASTPIESPS
jgi:hypothetical protein